MLEENAFFQIVYSHKKGKILLSRKREEEHGGESY